MTEVKRNKIEFVVDVKITEYQREFLKAMLNYHLTKPNVNEKLIQPAKEILAALGKSKTFMEELMEDSEKSLLEEREKRYKEMYPGIEVAGTLSIGAKHHLEDFTNHRRLVTFRIGTDDHFFEGDIVEVWHSDVKECPFQEGVNISQNRKLYFVEELKFGHLYDFDSDERMMEELENRIRSLHKQSIISYYWLHPYENKENINNAIAFLKRKGE